MPWNPDSRASPTDNDLIVRVRALAQEERPDKAPLIAVPAEFEYRQRYF